MVANNLTAALDLIIQWEGPEVNQANTEPGGISKYGISLVAYGDFCKQQKLNSPSFDTIANLTESDARGFYGNYWLPQIRFNDLPSGVDVRLADIAVNLGVHGALELTELVLLLWPLLGQLTDADIKALNIIPPEAIILSLSAGWISRKRSSTNWNEFAHGWINRNIAVTTQCLALIGTKLGMKSI